MLQLILSLESLGSRVYVTNIGLGTLQTTINGHGHLRVKIFQREENKNTRTPYYCYAPNDGSSSSSTSLQRNFLTSQAISVVKLGESRQLIRRRFSSMIIPGAVTLSRSNFSNNLLNNLLNRQQSYIATRLEVQSSTVRLLAVTGVDHIVKTSTVVVTNPH